VEGGEESSLSDEIVATMRHNSLPGKGELEIVGRKIKKE
jgi:hypothetical protein